MITIHVTKDDIKNGKRRICGYCPIALAIKRAIAPDYNFSVMVMNESVDINNNTTVKLPKRAQEFISMYDNHYYYIDKLDRTSHAYQMMQPFSFELEYDLKD